MRIDCFLSGKLRQLGDIMLGLFAPRMKSLRVEHTYRGFFYFSKIYRSVSWCFFQAWKTCGSISFKLPRLLRTSISVVHRIYPHVCVLKYLNKERKRAQKKNKSNANWRTWFDKGERTLKYSCCFLVQSGILGELLQMSRWKYYFSTCRQCSIRNISKIRNIPNATNLYSGRSGCSLARGRNA